MDSGHIVDSGLLFGLAIFAVCRWGSGPLWSVRWLWVGAAYLVLATTTAPALWRGLALGYEGDSFHTLSILGRAGLVLLSLALAIGVITLAAGKTARLYGFAGFWPLPGFLAVAVLDGLVNLLLLWLFLWLSPQLYYIFYLTQFDGLGWQWVVKPPPSPSAVLDILAMPRSGNLSEHGLGLLGRALVLLSLTAPALRATASLTRLRGPIGAAALPRFAITLAVCGALCQMTFAALLATL